MRRNAVHDLGYPHNAACLKLCGIQPVVDARLLVDLQGSMDENRPSVIGGPASVLDVFVWLDAQDGKQRISRALRPSTIPQRLWVRGGELRPAYPRLFSKKPKAIWPEAARNGLAALGRRRAFPLGRTMSVIGGNSEVSALREFFAV